MTIIYELPLPPSTNNMFVNGQTGQGRFPSKAYTDWKKTAHTLMMCQGRLKVLTGPVDIKLIVKDGIKGDLDNRLKACLDLMVKHGVIQDDSGEIVRRITLEWGDVAGARIEIQPAPPWLTRRGLAKRESA